MLKKLKRFGEWTVVKISNTGQLGKDPACFYGGYYLEPQKGETRWCTSSPGLTWFDRYIKDGPLYVVIPNSPRKFTGSMEVGEKTGLHTRWHCQYHVVWVPKYRFRVLHGVVKAAAESGIQAIYGYAGCEVIELNVQPDHVHLVVMIPPKLSISELLGRLKGQTSMKLCQQFRQLKKKPFWGKHFWAKGYCVDTVGLDADMIRKYARY